MFVKKVHKVASKWNVRLGEYWVGGADIINDIP